MAADAGLAIAFRFKDLTDAEFTRLRTQLLKSAVTVRVMYPKNVRSEPGVILVAEPSFCYVVVAKKIVKEELSYEIDFPGICLTKKGTDFFTSSNLGIIKVNHQFDLKNQIRPVVFSKEPVSMNEKLDLRGIRGELKRGYVNHADEESFFIDCSAGPGIDTGCAVFDENEEMVGIVCNYSGAFYAMTVSAIKEELRQLQQGKEVVEELLKLELI